MTKFKNTYQQFLKYLKDQFSNTERHDFEKSIQKDPFEQEALEGFDLLKGKELEEDMSLLSKKLQNKIKTETNLFQFHKLGIAASAIVLLGIGALYFNKEKEKSQDIVYDINTKELPSVTLEKPKDSIHTEIVFEEVNEIEKEEIIDLNIKKSTPVNKPKDNTEKKSTTQTPTTSSSTNIVNTEIVSIKPKKEKLLKSENVSQKIKIQARKIVDSTNNITLVNGIISGTDNFPLPGVNVKVKGKDIGVVSDFDGKYSMRVKQGDTLEFSGLGYETQKAVASNNLNISLKENTEALSEITVVGYGTTKKKRKRTPPYSLSKNEKNIEHEKIRKTKKSKVRIFRLKRGIGVRNQKTLKRATIPLDSVKNDTIKTKNNSESTKTIEDFGKWIDLKLNSALFEPGKIYHIEISFEINDLEQLDQLRFHTNNDIKIQNDLKRVLQSVPNWALDIFKDIPEDRIDLELEIFF